MGLSKRKVIVNSIASFPEIEEKEAFGSYPFPRPLTIERSSHHSESNRLSAPILDARLSHVDPIWEIIALIYVHISDTLTADFIVSMQYSE